ncbi:hypothetical protein CC79DRAFT_1336811 [Sarocladium strictum]
MSRVTQLSRTVSTAASRASSPLLDSTAHGAGASIMPKYADLLARRSNENQHDSRSITTAHRPTPQPSIANRTRPLMQTFSSSSKRSQASDVTILPSSSLLQPSSSYINEIRVPLLPDAYTTAHPAAAAPISETPEVTIVASDPENVIPASALTEVASAGGADTINLGFAHSSQQAESKDEGNMLTDLWKGMVDDVFGAAAKKA